MRTLELSCSYQSFCYVLQHSGNYLALHCLTIKVSPNWFIPFLKATCLGPRYKQIRNRWEKKSCCRFTAFIQSSYFLPSCRLLSMSSKSVVLIDGETILRTKIQQKRLFCYEIRWDNLSDFLNAGPHATDRYATQEWDFSLFLFSLSWIKHFITGARMRKLSGVLIFGELKNISVVPFPFAVYDKSFPFLLIDFLIFFG